MNLKSIIQLISKDMQLVEKIILKQLNSNIFFINKIINYIINGGKKIRPIICILIGHALGFEKTKHINFAALIEFIHIATLLHDDVIDRSKKRRGKKTINNVFGNKTSILIGDFIYSRTFQMMTNLKSMHILKIMSNATNTIVKGEILQLINSNNMKINEKIYMKIIYSKTAKLFEAATHVSAILSNANKKQQNSLQKYGKHLGIAFQLINDLLDYTKNKKKDIGNDLYEGKITLPLLHAINKSSLKESNVIKNAIKEKKISNFNNILIILKKFGSLEYTQKKAVKEAKKANRFLKNLPNSSYKEALFNLTSIITHHKY